MGEKRRATKIYFFQIKKGLMKNWMGISGILEQFTAVSATSTGGLGPQNGIGSFDNDASTIGIAKEIIKVIKTVDELNTKLHKNLVKNCENSIGNLLKNEIPAAFSVKKKYDNKKPPNSDPFTSKTLCMLQNYQRKCQFHSQLALSSIFEEFYQFFTFSQSYMYSLIPLLVQFRASIQLLVSFLSNSVPFFLYPLLLSFFFFPIQFQQYYPAVGQVGNF